MKDLARSMIVGFASGVLGASLVLWFSGTEEPQSEQPSPDGQELTGLHQRVAALEMLLVDRSAPPAATPQPEPRADSGATESSAGARTVSSMMDRSADDHMADYMKEKRQRTSNQLRAAGWSDAEIRSLDELKVAASLEMEQQMREAVEENPLALVGWGRSRALRDTLGEEKYEQYLVASSKPTAMAVNSILSGSAGEAAGLKQGDRIRRYGSERVYSEQDLMMSVLKGDPGEAVTIEVERDGAVFHVTVPRGPLGTSQIARMMIDN